MHSGAIHALEQIAVVPSASIYDNNVFTISRKTAPVLWRKHGLHARGTITPRPASGSLENSESDQAAFVAFEMFCRTTVTANHPTRWKIIADGRTSQLIRRSTTYATARILRGRAAPVRNPTIGQFRFPHVILVELFTGTLDCSYSPA